MDPTAIIWLGPVPGAIALVVLMLASLFVAARSENGTPPQAGRLAWLLAAMAVGLAYLPADFSINNFPGWWPKSATLRFGHIAAVSTLALALAALVRSRLLIAIVTGLLTAAALWAVLSTLHPRFISTPSMVVHLALGALIAAAAMLAPRVEASHARFTTPASLLIGSVFAGPILFLAHQASFAQQTGPLVAAMSAWLMVGFLRRRRPVPECVMGTFVVLLIALVAAGHHHSNTPVHTAATLAIVLIPLTPAAARLPIKQARLRALLPLGLSLVLGIAGLVIALLTAVPSTPSGY